MNNIKSAKSIKIAGGGIAGLSAAIKLKLNGFDPTVYEKEDKMAILLLYLHFLVHFLLNTLILYH